jgi:hypothetical protein
MNYAITDVAIRRILEKAIKDYSGIEQPNFAFYVDPIIEDTFAVRLKTPNHEFDYLFNLNDLSNPEEVIFLHWPPKVNSKHKV